MSRNLEIAITLAVSLLAAHAAAEEYRLQSLRIEHPFARATPPGAKAGGAYLSIENSGSTVASLVSAASPVAGAVELHQMAVDGGVMTMRAVRTLDVPPGGKLELKPGGYHIMLLDLKQPLRAGDKIPLKLTFQNIGTIEVSLDVEAMGATGVSGHKQ